MEVMKSTSAEPPPAAPVIARQQRADRRHVGADQQAERGADGGADQPDRGGRQEEGAHDGARRRAHGAQDGDAAALDPHQHGEARHHVHRRHHHDQGEDDEHHHPLDLQGAHEAGIEAEPVGDLEVVAAQSALRSSSATRGAAAGSAMSRSIELTAWLPYSRSSCSIGSGMKTRRAVELVAARQEARQQLVVGVARRDRAVLVQLVRDERDLVAGADVQRLAQALAHDDARSRAEGAEIAMDDVPGHDLARHAGLPGRTPRSSAPRVWPLAATSAWRSSVRRTACDAGKALSLASSSGVACTMPSRGGDHDVAVHADDAAEKLLAKAAHHRQHDDQGRHAQRHADQREDRDEGDEALALAGREIAPGEPAFDGGRRVTHGAGPSTGSSRAARAAG